MSGLPPVVCQLQPSDRANSLEDSCESNTSTLPGSIKGESEKAEHIAENFFHEIVSQPQVNGLDQGVRFVGSGANRVINSLGSNTPSRRGSIASESTTESTTENTELLGENTIREIAAQVNGLDQGVRFVGSGANRVINSAKGIVNQFHQLPAPSIQANVLTSGVGGLLSLSFAPHAFDMIHESFEAFNASAVSKDVEGMVIHGADVMTRGALLVGAAAGAVEGGFKVAAAIKHAAIGFHAASVFGIGAVAGAVATNAFAVFLLGLGVKFGYLAGKMAHLFCNLGNEGAIEYLKELSGTSEGRLELERLIGEDHLRAVINGTADITAIRSHLLKTGLFYAFISFFCTLAGVVSILGQFFTAGIAPLVFAIIGLLVGVAFLYIDGSGWVAKIKSGEFSLGDKKSLWVGAAGSALLFAVTLALGNPLGLAVLASMLVLIGFWLAIHAISLGAYYYHEHRKEGEER